MHRPTVTHAPLPRFRDVCRSLLRSPPSESALAEPWNPQKNVFHWFSRSAWSLLAVVESRRVRFDLTSVTIWIPDFFCEAALSLLRQRDVKIVFYPVDENLQPLFSKFPEINESSHPDIFILVHYFGKPSPNHQSYDFCQKHNAWLVEDAAHLLLPVPGVGETADFVLYSPHKHLPIPDGALLIVCQNGPSQFRGGLTVYNLFKENEKKLFNPKNTNKINIAIWFSKRILQAWGFRAKSKQQAFEASADENSLVIESARMSAVGKRLLFSLIPTLPAQAHQRRQCAEKWLEMLRRHCFGVQFEHDSSDFVPYLAKFRFPSRSTAEFVFYQLQSAKAPVTTWPDLPPEILQNPEKHVIAHHLRHTQLFLPVHYSVREGQISDCGTRLRANSLREWRVREIFEKDEWDALWRICPQKNLTQSWEYGQAKKISENWKTRRFIVQNPNNEPMAILQVLTKTLGHLGGIARINRGPLVLCDDPEKKTQISIDALSLITQEAQRQRWWLTQIAPFSSPHHDLEVTLRELGFQKQACVPMDSALLSLESDEESLLANLQAKWRNCLRKGYKLGVTVQIDDGGYENFELLLQVYRRQQAEKGFEGITEAMLLALRDSQTETFKFNIYLGWDSPARTEESLLGIVVAIQFGDHSEYLVGISNEKGRDKQVNSLLLWEAILDAKRHGCRWFDVGGLSAATPLGVSNFKRGLNAEPYQLTGEWRKISLLR